jgi:hypothetical protein
MPKEAFVTYLDVTAHDFVSEGQQSDSETRIFGPGLNRNFSSSQMFLWPRRYEINTSTV